MAVCVPRVQAFALESIVFARFPRMRHGRICGCTKIAGTNTWSQHAWGNAVDMVPPNKAYGDQVYAWLRANRETFGIATLCWFHQGGCTTGHEDHIHADFGGFRGVPSCAGGPIVPDAARVPCRRKKCPPLMRRYEVGGRCFCFPAVVPGINVPGAAESTADIKGTIRSWGDFIQLITTGKTWVRVGEVVSGGVLLILGFAALIMTFSKSQPATKVVHTLAPGVNAIQGALGVPAEQTARRRELGRYRKELAETESYRRHAEESEAEKLEFPGDVSETDVRAALREERATRERANLAELRRAKRERKIR